MQSPLARSTVQAVLPNDPALVEIDVIARMEVMEVRPTVHWRRR
jgi:hypothetical protein